jgi:hypothetical protein
VSEQEPAKEEAEQPASKDDADRLTPPERRLGAFAKYFFFLQIALLPVTLLVGDLIVGGIDLLAHTFLKMNLVEAQTNHFWQALTVSLVASLALCSFRLWRDPRGNLEWALPIVVATATASASFLGFALYYGALSLYLGLAFQVAMLLPTLFLWWRAAASRKGAGHSAV